MNQQLRVVADFGAVVDRPPIDPAQLVPTGLFRHVDAWLEHPGWMRTGTSLGPGLLPLHVTLRDAMQILDNIDRAGHGSTVLQLACSQQATPANPIAASLLDHAPDGEAALRALARYVNVTHPHLVMTVDPNGDRFGCALRARLPMARSSFALLGGLLTILLARYLQRAGRIGQDGMNLIVPGHGALLHQLLGVSVAERPTEACRIEVPIACVQRPNPGHDPILWQIALDRLADLEQAARQPDLVQRLEAVISAHLQRWSRLPTLSQAASAVGMSERTLSRRLGLQDMSLRDVADRVRRRRAGQLIGMASIAIDDIALRLGYPDQSSFSRHFRSWFGTTPARYRRTAGGDSLSA